MTAEHDGASIGEHIVTLGEDDSRRYGSGGCVLQFWCGSCSTKKKRKEHGERDAVAVLEMEAVD